MKKIILLILFISFAFRFSLNAQTVSNDFAKTMNDVFAEVDLNRVPPFCARGVLQ